MEKKTQIGPTKQKNQKCTVPPPISYGTREKQILRYLFNNPDQYFYIRTYSKANSVARSTIYSVLKRLKEKGLINKVRQVTTKGKKLLGGTKGGTKRFRTPCRKRSYNGTNLSTHFLKYKLKIQNRTKYDFENLGKLNPIETKKNKLRNFSEHYAYFEDSTIVIKLNTVMIHINDLLTDSVEEAHFKAFHIALKKAKELESIGIQTSEMICPQGHYARVESELSKKLHKVDNKYSLDLENGNKFWIDFSDKREDETDSPEYRERLDEFLLSLNGSKSDMKDLDQAKDDLDKLKEITKDQVKALAHLIQLQQIKTDENIIQSDPKDKKLMNYFG